MRFLSVTHEHLSWHFFFTDISSEGLAAATFHPSDVSLPNFLRWQPYSNDSCWRINHFEQCNKYWPWFNVIHSAPNIEHVHPCSSMLIEQNYTNIHHQHYTHVDLLWQTNVDWPRWNKTIKLWLAPARAAQMRFPEIQWSTATWDPCLFPCVLVSIHVCLGIHV